MLYLTEADVAQLITMPDVIAIVEESFRRAATGEVANVPRNRAIGKGVILHTMSAAADYLGYVGWKAYTTTKQGAKFLVGLYESASGRLVALIEADRLGQLRTGAVTGIAVKHLARTDADSLVLFGTGTQARTQLAAITAVRRLKRVTVYGRDAERRRKFVAEMSAELKLDVVAADSPTEAVRNAPIIVTATSSREPVFAGDDVSQGALVCAVGSNWLNKREIDDTAIRRAARVVCDDVAACRHEAGELDHAALHGAFDWLKAVPLADVIADKVAGRRTAEEIIVFKSVGLAAEDVAVGVELLRRAQATGIGTKLAV